jgi:hypothetical protein
VPSGIATEVEASGVVVLPVAAGATVAVVELGKVVARPDVFEAR